MKVVKKPSYAGIGLFATQPFKRGDRILEYTGRLLTDAEAAKSWSRYIFDLGNGYALDGRGREHLGRYLNHSCKPNAKARTVGKRLFIYAQRHIPKGEEVTIDYGYDYVDSFIPKCLCPHHPK